MSITRSSETRAETIAQELLTIRGWSVARPPRGDLLWKNEYREYPHLLEALKGRGKKGKGGDGYPDFIVIDRQTNQPLIVGETKGREDEIDLAINEADQYGEALRQSGLNVLAAGIAGDATSNIEVRVNKRNGGDWKPVEYRTHPIQWIPTPEETNLLLRDKHLFELQPRVPSNEILAKRGEEINRTLRECKITDTQRPAITGAFMLALWKSKGAIRMDAEHVLSDINLECRKAFVKAGKSEIAKSIYVPEANEKLAAFAPYICHILRLLNITTLTSEHDYLGQLYETFFRFTGGNTIGQFFTPRHITRFTTALCDVNRDDLAIDITCGTGGFLIACLLRMMAGRSYTHDQINELVKGHLIGFESEPITAALCVANMILRGDGTTGVIKGDCFTHPSFPIGKASVVVGNPPFPHAKTDDPPEKFIDRGLEALVQRGKLAMIVPSSLLVKPTKRAWREKTLKQHSLKAVITLPSELFQPYAAVTTAIIVLEKGVPHKANTGTFFCRIENDGFRIKKNTRIEQPGEQLTQALKAYQSGDSIPGFCTLTAWKGQEWAPGAYIKAAAHTKEEIKSEVSGLIRSLVGFHAHYAPQLAIFREQLNSGKLKATVYNRVKSITRSLFDKDEVDTIGGLFNVFYGQKSLHNKENLKPGASLVISSAGSDNGCYGFFEFSSLIAAPFVTIQSTGSIGEGFVQTWPCGVTDDCLILVPKADIWGTILDEEDMFIAAATARLERWRFDYGRKITPARLAPLKLNRDPDLKAWIKAQRIAASHLMVETIETLSNGTAQRLEKTFRKLAEQWREETGPLSNVRQKAMHPAYQRIIGMGKPAIPYILRELQTRREHWLWALTAVTGDDVAKPDDDFKQAVSAWLEWGKQKGYL